MKLASFLAPSVLAATALAACNATNAMTPTDPPQPPVVRDATCDARNVFQANGCTSCHGGKGPSADLDLDLPSADLAAKLLDAPSRTTVCAGRRLVDSRDPEASVLLSAVDHVRRERAGACALAMPPGGATAMPGPDVACLEQWVKDLTKRNDEEPFEPQPIEAATAKVKLLVHGGAVTAEELAAVQKDPSALRGLLDGWTKTPEFATKMRSFLGTALQQDSVGALKEGPGFPIAHFQPSQLLRSAVASSFVDAALDVVLSGRSFTEVVTTRRQRLSTAELVLLSYSEQTEQEIATTTFKVRLVGPAKKNNVPATLTLVGDTWELGGAAEDGQTCRFSPGGGPIPDVQSLPANRFLALLFGRVQCRGAVSGDLRYPAPVTAADHRDARFVTLAPSAAKQVAFHDLAKLRKVKDGDTLGFRVPRVGFAGTTVFLDNWLSNKDNDYRVTLNQTLLVGLGATFSMGDPTPSATSGIDEAHASPNTPCYGCHRLMDPMRPLLGNGMSTGYRAASTPPAPGTFAFFGQTRTGTSADDLAQAIALHPRFATAWVLKVCSWATSRACSDADPGVTELAAAFRASNHDFRSMLVDTLSSPLVTGLSGTPLSPRPVVSIARRRHLCAALRGRLGPAVETSKVCDTTDPNALARLVSDDAFARGQADFVQTAAPGTFHAAGLERLCVAIAPDMVDASFPATDRTGSIAGLVERLMGLPMGHPRHDAAIAALTAHLADVTAAGGSAAEAMQSAFVTACTSPDFAAAGL